MSRAVYIGGFANGRKGAERVAEALQAQYEDVDAFTFSEAMKHPERIRRATHTVATITHSAGMLALTESGAIPKEIHAFGAPLPTPILQFPRRTIQKRMRMHTDGIGITSPEDAESIKRYEASTMREIAAHPLGNFRHLGKIAQYDAVEAAIIAEKSDIHTSLIYTHGDEYFQLAEARETAARAIGVSVLRIDGIHDELPLRPTATLDLFYQQLA